MAMAMPISWCATSPPRRLAVVEGAQCGAGMARRPPKAPPPIRDDEVPWLERAMAYIEAHRDELSADL